MSNGRGWCLTTTSTEVLRETGGIPCRIKDINMHIRVSGEKVGMPIDQWCEIIADDGENLIVRRSIHNLANPARLDHRGQTE